jgi:hypothetical protein
VCDHTKFDIEYGGVDATEVSCVAGSPTPNQATLTLSAGTTLAVTAKWSYGALEDSLKIGNQYNNKIPARTSPLAITQTVGPEPTPWVLGVTTTAPDPGECADPLLSIAFCWEKTVVTPPLAITNVQYGGQACTQIGAVDTPDDQAALTALVAVWRCSEAAILAATSATITYTPSETPTATKPVLVASRFTCDIEQATPLVSSATGTTAEGNSITTADLTTSNPGIAALAVCAGSNGAFTAGGGGTLQLDQPEDSSPDAMLGVVEWATTGATVAPAATFASTDADGTTRLSAVAWALDGGEPSSSDVTTYTQVGWRCADAAAPPLAWAHAAATACRVVPDHRVLLVQAYKVTGAAEPQLTGKSVQCCDDSAANCTEPAQFYTVDTTYTGGRRVAFAPTTTFLPGAQIACPFAGLPDPGGTCVAGRLFQDESVDAVALAADQWQPLGHVLRLNPATPAGSTVTCRLGVGAGTPILGQAATLTVIAGEVGGGL